MRLQEVFILREGGEGTLDLDGYQCYALECLSLNVRVGEVDDPWDDDPAETGQLYGAAQKIGKRASELFRKVQKDAKASGKKIGLAQIHVQVPCSPLEAKAILKYLAVDDRTKMDAMILAHHMGQSRVHQDKRAADLKQKCERIAGIVS